MATWSLSPQYKKSAIEKMFFYRDGKCIVIEQGFRWSTFTVESDERPLTDEALVNNDDYELGCIDNDECWEMQDMMDGCWLDISARDDDVTAEELAEFEEAWEEDSYEGVEAKGWTNDDTEYYYSGPLQLTNEDTGEVFYGEPPEPQEKTEEQLKAELDELIASMPEVPTVEVAPTLAPVVEDRLDIPVLENEEMWAQRVIDEEPKLTDWYPATINPARKGTYQVINTEVVAWPFAAPQPVEAKWGGKKWNTDNVLKWRGLAQDPKKA